MKSLKHILNHILLHFELEETERMLIQLPESLRSDVFKKINRRRKNFSHKKTAYAQRLSLFNKIVYGKIFKQYK